MQIYDYMQKKIESISVPRSRLLPKKKNKLRNFMKQKINLSIRFINISLRKKYNYNWFLFISYYKMPQVKKFCIAVSRSKNSWDEKFSGGRECKSWFSLHFT